MKGLTGNLRTIAYIVHLFAWRAGNISSSPIPEGLKKLKQEQTVKKLTDEHLQNYER